MCEVVRGLSPKAIPPLSITYLTTKCQSKEEEAGMQNMQKLRRVEPGLLCVSFECDSLDVEICREEREELRWGIFWRRLYSVGAKMS